MLMMLGIAMPGYDIVNWHLQFHYIRTTSSYVCSSEAKQVSIGLVERCSYYVCPLNYSCC